MTDSWIGKSDSWGNAADWSGGVPTAQQQVQIDVAGVTVTIGSGVAAVCYTLNVQGSTLSLAGGTLYTVAGATLNGIYLQSSGTYTAGGTGAVFDQALLMSGGTIDLLGDIKTQK